MNPEQFHDALNYLDDDLIRETDELRQGRQSRRPRPGVRKIIAWAVPAACLVLVIGLGPRFLPGMDAHETAGSAANGMNMEAESPAEAIQDQIIYEGAEVNSQESRSEYALRGVSCEDVYMEIPETWTCEIARDDDGSYFLVICPPQAQGVIRVGHYPNFGVCGTGLTTEETVIAGMDATVGTYDGNHVWSFITFGDDYVVLNEGADAWWGQHGELFMKCLETLVIG